MRFRSSPIGTAVVITVGVLGLIASVTAVDQERVTVSRTTEERVDMLQQPVEGYGSRPACSLTKTNGTAQYFLEDSELGMRVVTYFDPANFCGSPVYPFQIMSLSFTLFDAGEYQWPVELDVVVYNVPTSGDPCEGPAAERCRFGLICDEAAWSYPNIGTADFPIPCCINDPFYIGVEYTDTGVEKLPMLIFDNKPEPDTCDNWCYYGGWHEWYDFWATIDPGYPLFWVDGETSSAECRSLLKLNEIKPYPQHKPADDDHFDYSFVELYNSDEGPEDITGWSVTNIAKAIIATMPSANLPGGAFLRVYFGVGTDDFDFSDGYGEMYTGGDSSVLASPSDGIGLYDETAAIIDFVTWSSDGSTPSGAALTDAVAAGIWTDGAFLDYAPLVEFSTYGLCPDGVDHGDPSDWRELPWDDYLWWDGPENPIQISPMHGGFLEEVSSVLTWGSIAYADSYLVEFDDDSLFGSPELAQATLDTSAIVPGPPPEGIYYWRARVFESEELLPAFVRFEVLNVTSSPKSGTWTELPVPHLIQHKDTPLLCIWNVRPNDADWRPGCDETKYEKSGPWDGEHHITRDHVRKCEHCSRYCGRACVAMVNNYKGGNLSQDRISYELFFNQYAMRPEGNLGHRCGTKTGYADGSHGLGRLWPIYEWAMGTTIDGYDGVPSFETIKTEIDNDRPILASTGSHWTVVVGYCDRMIGSTRFRSVKINDPWPLNLHYRDYRAWSRTIEEFFLLPASGINARMQESTVTTDGGDGDGIMDFDEGRPGYPPERPRRFHCKFNNVDSDSDEVMDKNEIRNYTFHDTPGYHNGHYNDNLDFPDDDHDGLRAEGDCDSDNDGDFDGGEDINGDGHNPVVESDDPCEGETCQFKAAKKCIMVNTDKDNYWLGDPVYIVDWHNARETHTYHANSTYNYELGDGCPDYADSQSLSWYGSFKTDAGGHANQTLVMHCSLSGDYYLYVDVLSDHHYSEPDNTDPFTCWTCEGFWFHGWHWGFDWEWHNPEYQWPLFPYPSICYPDTPARLVDVIQRLPRDIPQPDRPRRSEKSPGDSSPIGTRQDCEILSFWDGETMLCWPIPNAPGDDYYNMGFTPTGTCTLTTVYMAFDEAGSVVGTPSGIDVIVWEDDGTGYPSAELARVNVPAPDIIWFPGWTVVDLSPFELIFDKDFHIGYTTVSPQEDVYAMVSDDGYYGQLRSTFWWDGSWYYMADEYMDVNFLIQAEVCYEERPWVDVSIYCPWWWWCYDWPPGCRYRLGVSVPTDMWEYGDISVNQMPTFVIQDNECQGPVIMEFQPDGAVEDSLNELFGDEQIHWLGFSTPYGWELPDSLMTTCVTLSVNTAVKSELLTAIRLGDDEFGWPPVFYDSLLIQIGGPSYVCGDAGASGEVDIDDVVYLIAYIFSGGPEPVPYESGDADCSGGVDIDDAVWLIAYIFSGGNTPCDTDGDGVPDC